MQKDTNPAVDVRSRLRTITTVERVTESKLQCGLLVIITSNKRCIQNCTNSENSQYLQVRLQQEKSANTTIFQSLSTVLTNYGLCGLQNDKLRAHSIRKDTFKEEPQLLNPDEYSTTQETPSVTS